jgi:hypothetical protein
VSRQGHAAYLRRNMGSFGSIPPMAERPTGSNGSQADSGPASRAAVWSCSACRNGPAQPPICTLYPACYATTSAASLAARRH